MIETAREYEYKLLDKRLIEIYDSDVISIYENDIKYTNYNQIDINRTKGVKKNKDTVEYRLKECMDNGGVTLDFSHLDLKTLPSVPNSLWHTLHNLFLGSNDIAEIDDLRFLFELQVIDISNNNLTRLPKLPEHIEELTVKNNKLFNIDSLSKCDCLKRLDCSENTIVKLPVIDNLEILICDKNKIDNMPLYKTLKKLSCCDNFITDIPEMNYLEVMECDKNRISIINNLQSLKELYCNKDPFEEIRGVPKLEILHCCRTKVKKIEYIFSLKELVCDDNIDISLSKHYKIKSSETYKNGIRVITFE